MVSGFAKLGAYFSFSGYLTAMKSTKAKKMLKAVCDVNMFNRLKLVTPLLEFVHVHNVHCIFLVGSC